MQAREPVSTHRPPERFLGSTLRDALPTSSIFQPSFLNFSTWRRVFSTMFPLEKGGILWAAIERD